MFAKWILEMRLCWARVHSICISLRSNGLVTVPSYVGPGLCLVMFRFGISRTQPTSVKIQALTQATWTFRRARGARAKMPIVLLLDYPVTAQLPGAKPGPPVSRARSRDGLFPVRVSLMGYVSLIL